MVAFVTMHETLLMTLLSTHSFCILHFMEQMLHDRWILQVQGFLPLGCSKCRQWVKQAVLKGSREHLLCLDLSIKGFTKRFSVRYCAQQVLSYLQAVFG